jgi:soluble lytic murein transglycosylase
MGGDTRQPRARPGARSAVVFAAVVLVCLVAGSHAQQTSQPSGSATAGGIPLPPPPVLTPTRHQPVSRDPACLWLAPVDADHAARPPSDALASLAVAVRLQAGENYEQSLPLLNAPALAGTPLAEYATYYLARAELKLLRWDEARRRFAALSAGKPAGYLAEAAALGEAEAAEGQKDYPAALRIYNDLRSREPSAPDELWLRIANAGLAGGNRTIAANAYLHLYTEYPLSDRASQAESAARMMTELEPLKAGTERYRLELARADTLFVNRRYADARTAFTRIRPSTSGTDRGLVGLRLAECEYYLRRYRTAREALGPYVSDGTHQAEARYFLAAAARKLGDPAGFQSRMRALVSEHPDSRWAEDALNDLASFYVQQDRDEDADRVLRELYDRFPTGRYAERAAWKIGWRAYRVDRFAEAATIFEKTAAAFPRSDYRPAYLYWAGRARDAAGDSVVAGAHFALVTADYLNSYYGRLAARALEARGQPPAASALAFVQPPAPDEWLALAGRGGTELASVCGTVRALLALGLYDDATNELNYARRTWGDMPAFQATAGWIAFQQGALRRAINAMRRAYPQFMAAGGEQLPLEVQTIIFPVDYWDLIRSYAGRHGLDPYLLAALIAQESTFDAGIRSPARAVGLMQLMPATARRYASILKMRYTTAMLRNPESNIRLGTAYLSDLIEEFGQLHLALAGYNAGEGRVRAWLAERGRLDQDEFVDDIPFAETQNYVKRILGTAEDYRRLYGPGGLAASTPGAQQQSRVAANTSTATAAPAQAAPKPPAAKPAPASTAQTRTQTRPGRP